MHPSINVKNNSNVTTHEEWGINQFYQCWLSDEWQINLRPILVNTPIKLTITIFKGSINLSSYTSVSSTMEEKCVNKLMSKKFMTELIHIVPWNDMWWSTYFTCKLQQSQFDEMIDKYCESRCYVRCIEGANVTADNMSVGRKDDDFRNEVDCWKWTISSSWKCEKNLKTVQQQQASS